MRNHRSWLSATSAGIPSRTTARVCRTLAAADDPESFPAQLSVHADGAEQLVLLGAIVMVWIFALGIIWLALVHEGFRKVVFWILGIAAVAVIGIVASAAIGIIH